MRRKVSTIMDEAVFRHVKLEAARQGRPMSAILEEALLQYFEGTGGSGAMHRTVADTWGALAGPPELIRAVMEDEDGWLDT